MAKMPLISVVLPTYHIPEAFFTQCINSIRHQSYTNWEAIIIDDGNLPEYAAWLDTFADNQVRVIHQKNGGLAAARNRGGKEANGEWIFYCDPDDWLHKDELLVLMQAALASQADIAVCQYTRVYEGDVVPPESDCVLGEYHVITQKDIDEVMLELIAPQRAAALHRNEWLSTCAVTFAWGHLYRRSLALSVDFPPLYPGEDKVFNLYASEKANRIVFALTNLHYYRIGTGITGRLNQRAIDNSLYGHSILFEFIKKHPWSSDITCEINKTIMDEMAVITKCLLNESKNVSEFKNRVREYIQPKMYQRAIQDTKNPIYTKKQRMLCKLYQFGLYHILASYWRIHK